MYIIEIIMSSPRMEIVWTPMGFFCKLCKSPIHMHIFLIHTFNEIHIGCMVWYGIIFNSSSNMTLTYCHGRGRPVVRSDALTTPLLA